MNNLTIAPTNGTPEMFNPKHLQLIKDSYFKGSSNEEFELFIHVCKRTGLDPAFKQIHPVPRWDNKLKRNTLTFQVGIDGFRLIAERTGRYAPGRQPTYEYDKEGKLMSATAYVKKQTADGTWHEIAATAFYKEYVQRTKDGKIMGMWAQMEHNQLAKCAESLALRKAFPGDLSGLYTKEEMDQADIKEASPDIEIIQQPLTVTQEQSEELSSIVSECDPATQQKFMGWLKSKNVNAINELPAALFETIKNAAMKKRDEYMISKNNEDQFDQIANEA